MPSFVAIGTPANDVLHARDNAVGFLIRQGATIVSSSPERAVSGVLPGELDEAISAIFAAIPEGLAQRDIAAALRLDERHVTKMKKREKPLLWAHVWVMARRLPMLAARALLEAARRMPREEQVWLAVQLMGGNDG